MPLAIPFQTPKHLPRGCQVLRIPQTRASPLRRFNYYENHKPDALTAMKEALISSDMESSWPSTPSWPSSSGSSSGSKNSGSSSNGGGASWGKKGTSSGDNNKGKKTSGAGQNNSIESSKGRKGYSPSNSGTSSTKADDKPSPSGISRPIKATASTTTSATGTAEVKINNTTNTTNKWPAQKGFRQKQQAENTPKSSPKSSSTSTSAQPPPSSTSHTRVTGVQGPYINNNSSANK